MKSFLVKLERCYRLVRADTAEDASDVGLDRATSAKPEDWEFIDEIRRPTTVIEVEED